MKIILITFPKYEPLPRNHGFYIEDLHIKSGPQKMVFNVED